MTITISTRNTHHLGVEPRHTLRHIGYDLYATWSEGEGENKTYCVQEIGEQLIARFPTEQEREAYFIEQEIAFAEWIEYVFPGQLRDMRVAARNDDEDNSPARIHAEM